jgi:hypothetical protein
MQGEKMKELSDEVGYILEGIRTKDRDHAVVTREINLLKASHPFPYWFFPGTDPLHFTDLHTTDKKMDTNRDIFMDIKGYTERYNLVYMYMYTKLYIELDKEMDTKMDGIVYT